MRKAHTLALCLHWLLAAGLPAAHAFPQAGARTTAPVAPDFPAAPTGGHVRTLKLPPEEADESETTFRIQSPQSFIPKGLPVAHVTQDSRFRGRLTYLIRSQPISYAVLQKTGFVVGKSAGPLLAAYPTRAYDVLYEPHFSRDGHSMLLKVGWPFDSHGSYDLYRWDFSPRQLNLVLSGKVIEPLAWSPDQQRLAYLQGEEKGGYRNFGATLWVRNLKNGKEYLEGGNVGWNDISWGTDGTLYFAVTSLSARSNKSVPAPHRDIMAVVPGVATPRKIIEDGQTPAPSPDGKWLAFVRPALGGKIRGVYLWNGRKEVALPVGPSATFLTWSRDSRELFVIDCDRKLDPDRRLRNRAKVTSYNPATGKSKLIGSMTAWDYAGGSRNSEGDNFQPQGLSRDGRYLFVSVSEFTGAKNYMYCQLSTLRALDLISGEVTNVASLDDPDGYVVGWDWREESVPLDK